jgi:hypothetical protein
MRVADVEPREAPLAVREQRRFPSERVIDATGATGS